MARRLALLVFDGVEVLDFAGPYEVFAVARDIATGAPLFDVMVVAERLQPVTAANNLSFNPQYTLETCPTPEIILVPGGDTRAVRESQPVLRWLKAHIDHVELMLSVCTGALVLGMAGLLDGLTVTTYHTAFNRLAEMVPTAVLQPGERWVDNGQVVTSAGFRPASIWRCTSSRSCTAD